MNEIIFTCYKPNTCTDHDVRRFTVPHPRRFSRCAGVVVIIPTVVIEVVKRVLTAQRILRRMCCGHLLMSYRCWLLPRWRLISCRWRRNTRLLLLPWRFSGSSRLYRSALVLRVRRHRRLAPWRTVVLYRLSCRWWGRREIRLWYRCDL